jgi:FkbM family methyltransferase
MLKAAKRLAAVFGLHATRRSSVPFGCDKFADIAALLPDLSLALDVGANYGQTVEEMREYFPSARIISFEPVPAIFEALKAATGHDRHVECIPCAVGAEAGMARMTALEHTGRNTLNVSARPNEPMIDIPVIALDQFCAERGIAEIDLLKIDTEGYEVSVLNGALGLLKSGAIRAVLAECEFINNPSEPHGDFFEISRILMPLGYRVAAFYSGGLDGNGWRWGDVLFMRARSTSPVYCSPFTVPAKREARGS